MSDIDIQIPDKIGNIFKPTDNVRYRVAYGGRGSGKSIGFARMLLVRSLSKPGKYLCCRELQKSIKTSVHSILSAEISRLGLQEYFDVGKEYLRTADGSSEFLFFGLRSNAEEIKSTHGVEVAWVEEAQAVSQFSWDMLIPTIREDNSEIWATFNPQDELDPVYEMFVTDPRRKSVIAEVNYDDNPWFPQVLEDERLECLEKSPEKYGWIWQGKLYVNVNAAVYGKWIEAAKDAGRIRKGIYDPSLPVMTSWDLGYSDDTAIWWYQVAGNELRMIDYYENSRQDIRHYAEQIYGREIPLDGITYGENGKVVSYTLGKPLKGAERRMEYNYGDNFVPHDAANKLLQAGGRSVVDQLHEFGIKSRVVNATSQQNQISAARSAIELAWFDEENCKQGIRCLKKYAFEERDGEKGYSQTPKHDVYSHGADSFEVCAQVWKTPKEVTPAAKPKFLHEMSFNDIIGGEGYSNPSGYDGRI
jgi:phage terminase large subunit